MGSARSRVLGAIGVAIAVAACGLDFVGVAPVVTTDDAGMDASIPPPVVTPETPDAATPDANVPDAAGCATACKATEACEGTTCVPVAAQLSGFRYQLECSGPAGTIATSCAEPTSIPATSVTLTGTSGHVYDIHIRVRGAVEQRTYPTAVSAGATGTNAAFFVTAPNTVADEWNAYPLAVSSPPNTYYVNSGASGNQYVDMIDYTAAIRASAGASIKMQSNSSDAYMIRNLDQSMNPIVISGVATTPSPFDGQFIQIDVDSVGLVP